jgi:hypothetical protein
LGSICSRKEEKKHLRESPHGFDAARRAGATAVVWTCGAVHEAEKEARYGIRNGDDPFMFVQKNSASKPKKRERAEPKEEKNPGISVRL